MSAGPQVVAATFEASLDFIWGPGRDGQKDDRAPGEHFATAYGVTDPLWDQAVRDGLVTGPIGDATRDECGAILRAYFWNALRCAALPEGVGLMVFNDGVLCGSGHAARLLQRIIGVTQDGAIGPQTLRAARAYGTRALINALAAGDEAYMASLRRAPLFIDGWTRREEDARQLAYRMAGL